MSPSQPFLAGKPVLLYGGGTGKRTTPEDLRRHLRRFPSRHTLRLLGEISGRMWTDGVSGVRLGSVPLPAHAIPYLALLAVESSNDYRGRPMRGPDIERLASLFLDLDEPASAKLADDEQAAFEFVLRTGNQFEFQRELRHQLPRIVMLLEEVWPRVEKAKNIKPADDLVRLTGLDLHRLLFFGWAFSQAGVKGSFGPYSEAQGLPLFSTEAQAAFLNWGSADYATIRRLGAAAKATLPNDTFDPYRFNPLLTFSPRGAKRRGAVSARPT